MYVCWTFPIKKKNMSMFIEKLELTYPIENI